MFFFKSLLDNRENQYLRISNHQNGQPLEIIDGMHSKLHQAAQETSNDPLAFIKQEQLFGVLATNERFTKSYTAMLQERYKTGIIKTLMQRLL